MPEKTERFRLTRDLICAAKTKAGGFTRAQYLALGFSPKGTKVEDMEGTLVTRAEYDAFVAAGEVRVKLSEKQKKRFAKIEARRLKQRLVREAANNDRRSRQEAARTGGRFI